MCGAGNQTGRYHSGPAKPKDKASNVVTPLTKPVHGALKTISSEISEPVFFQYRVSKSIHRQSGKGAVRPGAAI
jgi:hypothetical protein